MITLVMGLLLFPSVVDQCLRLLTITLVLGRQPPLPISGSVHGSRQVMTSPARMVAFRQAGDLNTEGYHAILRL